MEKLGIFNQSFFICNCFEFLLSNYATLEFSRKEMCCFMSSWYTGFEKKKPVSDMSIRFKLPLIRTTISHDVIVEF